MNVLKVLSGLFRRTAQPSFVEGVSAASALSPREALAPFEQFNDLEIKHISGYMRKRFQEIHDVLPSVLPSEDGLVDRPWGEPLAEIVKAHFDPEIWAGDKDAMRAAWNEIPSAFKRLEFVLDECQGCRLSETPATIFRTAYHKTSDIPNNVVWMKDKRSDVLNGGSDDLSISPEHHALNKGPVEEHGLWSIG